MASGNGVAPPPGHPAYSEFQPTPDHELEAQRQAAEGNGEFDLDESQESRFGVHIEDAPATNGNGSTDSYDKGMADALELFRKQGYRKPEPDFDGWHAIEPLEKIEYAPDEDMAAHLPSWVSNMVVEVGAWSQAPQMMAALFAISSLSIMARKGVKARYANGFTVSCNLYTIAALPPSERKSSVQTRLMRPLFAWQDDKNKVIEADANEIRRANDAIKADIERVNRQQRGQRAIDQAEFTERMTALEESLKPVPGRVQLMVNDVTPEALTDALTENGEVTSIVDTEGGFFGTLAGRYSGGVSNIDLILKCFSGDFIAMRRVKRGEIVLKEPIMSMMLAVQPAVLLEQLNNREFLERGLISRFAMIRPKPNQGNYKAQHIHNVDREVEELYAINMRALADFCDVDEPIVIDAQPAAFALWAAYADEIQTQLRPGGDLASDDVQDGWGGKHADIVYRIAALLHIAQDPINISRFEPGEISELAMGHAIEIGKIFRAHYLKLKQGSHMERENTIAEKLLDWIKSEPHREQFTHRELSRKFRTMDEHNMRSGLVTLSDSNIIRPGTNHATKQHRGRPTEIFEVNPFLWSNESVITDTADER